jgi:hypothetical protein
MVEAGPCSRNRCAVWQAMVIAVAPMLPLAPAHAVRAVPRRRCEDAEGTNQHSRNPTHHLGHAPTPAGRGPALQARGARGRAIGRPEQRGGGLGTVLPAATGGNALARDLWLFRPREFPFHF